MTDLAKLPMALLLGLSLIGGGVLSGCGLVAAGTAGGVAATELEEDDGRLDPLEESEVTPY